MSRRDNLCADTLADADTCGGTRESVCSNSGTAIARGNDRF